MGGLASARAENVKSSSPAQQDAEGKNDGIPSSNSKEPSLISRVILKEASVQSPLAAAPSYGVFERYHGSKGLKKLFYRIHKQKDGLLKNIEAQDSFAIPKEERGLICWRERGNRPDGDGNGTVIYGWLSGKTRIGFQASTEWTLYIECVNPSVTTPTSGSSSSGVFVEIRRYLHPSVEADDRNPGIYGSTSTHPGEMSVRINDVPIEINVRVGPLPNFAVIEMNGSAAFWWRTKEALNFVPKKTRPTRSFVDSQGYENLGAALPAVKRQRLSLNTAISRFRGSGPRNEEEESFQSPNRSRAGAGYVAPDTAAPTNTAAPLNTVAPPKTNFADNTDTAINPVSPKIPPKEAPYINKPPKINEPSSALSRPNWKAKLERGLRRHKEFQKHAAVPQILDQNQYSEFDARITKKSPLDDSKNLSDDEVVKGIATIWTALQNHGKHFAFGSTNTFIGYRSEDFQGMMEPAVKGPKYPFIIPLVFDPESDNTEHGHPKSGIKGKMRQPPGIGHHILAVGRVTDGPINVSVLDTAPRLLKRERIEEAVTAVVIRSGWLGKDESGDVPLPVWPKFKFEYPTVPEYEGWNTCGLYAILNAWATMLELEITPHRTRRHLPQEGGEEEEVEEEPFEIALMDLINLAISGHLDSETIVAFVVSYGYVLEPRDPDSIPKVQLDQNYNQNLVAQAIYEARQKDKVELAEAIRLRREEGQEHVVAEDDIRYIIAETCCRREWAIEALKQARGFRNIAPFFVPPERRARRFLFD